MRPLKDAFGEDILSTMKRNTRAFSELLCVDGSFHCAESILAEGMREASSEGYV